MNLKQHIYKNYANCLESRCKDRGCLIKLDNISSDHVIISGEKYKNTYKYSSELCDFILFDNVSKKNVQTAVLELKGGEVDESEFYRAFSQLKNGAAIADQISKETEIITFVVCLAKGGKINTIASRMLVNDKFTIVLRGIRKYIKVISCGDSIKFD